MSLWRIFGPTRNSTFPHTTISYSCHMPKKRKKSASRVWVPPESAYVLAPRPLLQQLPLLQWEYFQRLCARLAQCSGDVEFSQEYGLPGQDQEGIDIYVRHRSSGRYSVWQCKRYPIHVAIEPLPYKHSSGMPIFRETTFGFSFEHPF